MRMPRLASCLLAWLLPLQLPAADTGQWIDLTHELSAEAVFWPTAAPFSMTTDFEGLTDKGFYYSAYSFTTAEHGGTHIDAPVHFAQGANHVDEIPLEQLIGDAVVIDVSRAVRADRDHRISVADIEAFEAQQGVIPAGSIVLFRTGFGQYWPDAEKYLGTALRGEAGVTALSFPGLDKAAAEWLMDNRHIKAVGIDTASIDHGKSTHFETHVALMSRNVPAFENVANLDLLPSTGVFVVALPVKIRGGSGGPLRIIARVTGAAQATDLQTLQQQVETTERAFARTMAERDHDAFTAFLSEEAIFFSDAGPLRGQRPVAEAWKAYFDEPVAPFSWEPELVVVPDSGTLALSSGPVRNPAGERVATFNSVWRREPDGQWRIVFDKGSRDCPAPGPAAAAAE